MFDNDIKTTELTVLYVEDHEVVRSETLNIFNALFKEVIVAEDGVD